MRFPLRQLGILCVLALALTRTAHAQAEDDKTPLGRHMSTMNRSLRAISAQVDDAAKNASTLEHLSIIETNATEAMALKPEKLAQVPEAEQTKFLEDFQAGIKALLVTVGELRTAVAEGRNADAAKLVDGIKAQQKEGHAEFRIRKAGAP